MIDRITESAVEEFETKGYLGAKTQAIARRAGVAEALLFTHFGSKSGLFGKVISNPLSNHFDEFVKKNLVDLNMPGPSDARSREYMTDFQAFIEQHADTILCLFFNEIYNVEDDRETGHVGPLREYITKMSNIYERKLDHPVKIDPRLFTRISIATQLSCVIFKDILFEGEDFSQEEIRKAIVDFIMEGTSANSA